VDYVIDLVYFHIAIEIEFFRINLGLQVVLQCIDLPICEFIVFEREVFFATDALEFQYDWQGLQLTLG